MPTYNNVMDEIIAFLLERADMAKSAGVEESNIIIDPGIGFGKTFQHNLEIIMYLKSLANTGY